MKILAMYLPQYHETKENNEWWGKGYTEWTAVKNARPLFKNHNQPRRPFHNNYYDLVKQGVETWTWQANLAKKYGVYGFCIYHYWFQGRQLLERPMEILRDHPEIDIRYCVCWANESWRKNWYGQKKTLLLEQTYGNIDDWIKHFNYLYSFFCDDRYIKIENKPVINIYRSYDIKKLQEMLNVWDKMAKERGFAGLYIVSAMTAGGYDEREFLFDAYYDFEPGFTLKKDLSFFQKRKYLLKVGLIRIFNMVSKKKILEHKINIKMIYKRIEGRILPEKCFPGTFPQWDNTPRTGYQGLCYRNSSPQLYYNHMKTIWEKYADNKIFLYINAWNEWGEGAYLEPDEENGYNYLECIKRIVKEI
mgnify:CR=1 FL=1